MKEIILNEKKLLTWETRRDAEQLQQFLHAEFMEIGESGTTYDRDAVIKLLSNEGASSSKIHSQHFSCTALASDVAMVTYNTARQGVDGSYSNFTKRSSIWVHSEGTWKMRYHQGTTCGAFPTFIE